MSFLFSNKITTISTGLVCVLNKIRPDNYLGHPLCENLRNGDWLMHCMVDRLKAFPGTETVSTYTNSFMCIYTSFIGSWYIMYIILHIVVTVGSVVRESV